jgi:hypothetical protein
MNLSLCLGASLVRQGFTWQVGPIALTKLMLQAIMGSDTTLPFHIAVIVSPTF